MVELGLQIWAASCHSGLSTACFCHSNLAALQCLSPPPQSNRAPPTPDAPWNALTIRSFVLLLSWHLQENLSQFSPLLLIWSPSGLPLRPTEFHFGAKRFLSVSGASWMRLPTMHCARARGLCQLTPLLTPNTCCDPSFLFSFSLRGGPPCQTHTGRAQTGMCKRTFLSFFSHRVIIFAQWRPAEAGTKASLEICSDSL